MPVASEINGPLEKFSARLFRGSFPARGAREDCGAVRPTSSALETMRAISWLYPVNSLVSASSSSLPFIFLARVQLAAVTPWAFTLLLPTRLPVLSSPPSRRQARHGTVGRPIGWAVATNDMEGLSPGIAKTFVVDIVAFIVRINCSL